MADATWMKEYLKAWDSHDAAKVVSFMTDDCVYEDVALGQVHKGRADIEAFVKEAETFSSDYRFEPVTEFSTDTNYGAEWVMSGTHTGEAAGLPATNKAYKIRGVSVGTLENGKIKENHDYWNMADFLVQIGIMPAPPTA